MRSRTSPPAGAGAAPGQLQPAGDRLVHRPGQLLVSAFLNQDIDPAWVAKVLGDLAIGPLGPGRVFLVFLTPDPAISIFGLAEVDLVGLVVAICLLWVLLRIPIWATRLVFTPRSSTVVQLARSLVIYRGLGRLTRRS